MKLKELKFQIDNIVKNNPESLERDVIVTSIHGRVSVEFEASYRNFHWTENNKELITCIDTDIMG